VTRGNEGGNNGSGARLTPPLLIAHRGAPRERPENTLPSFLRALELGADGIELDVHATRDGVVVVHHDDVPRASAPSPALAGRRIDRLTFDELQGFSIRGMALIPTLSEVLAVVKGRAEMFIEIKAPGVEEAVVDVINASYAPERCAVHSFHVQSIQRIRELAPDIRRGILFERLPDNLLSLIAAAGAADVWPELMLVNEELVAAVHSAGARVIAWTVNRAERATTLAEFGVDGLCTDNVPQLRTALAVGPYRPDPAR
jgi:glycerophosphoryl diester phosphodiesterase